MTNRSVKNFKFEPISPNKGVVSKVNESIHTNINTHTSTSTHTHTNTNHKPKSIHEPSKNKKKIKEMCPYLFLGHNHSHPRLVFPHHSELSFNNMGNGTIVIEEERYIQENGSYDAMLDIHEEFSEVKKDLITIIETFSNYSFEVHLIHIQSKYKGQEYDNPTWKKKNKSEVQPLDTSGNVMLFIINYSRNVFWTGFYFRFRKRKEDNNNNNNNNNNNHDPNPTKGITDINPFISTLDLSRDPDLFKLFDREFQYLGFLFEVCPCVK